MSLSHRNLSFFYKIQTFFKFFKLIKKVAIFQVFSVMPILFYKINNLITKKNKNACVCKYRRFFNFSYDFVTGNCIDLPF